MRERYKLRHVLGQGAHGVSFFAEHLYLNHPCVVKLLPHRSGSASDVAARRLRNEARAGFQVSDPHVVRVLDCDVINGVWFFVMEFVAGGDLATLIDANVRVPWQQAAVIAADAARGLAAIHRIRHVHRDIKPGNLLLGSDGRTRVADLGIAAVVGGEDQHERVGTLAYAAPESFDSDVELDARADLYSLGAALFHLTTGQHPFEHAGVLGALMQMQTRAPEWPDDAAATTPAWLRDGILRLLATDRHARFASADEFVRYLENPGQAAPARTDAQTARVAPRGVAILPFQNVGAASDDWLGQAVADYAARSLGQCPGVFVVNAQQVLELLEVGQDPTGLDSPRLTEAGRLVGAAMVVSGSLQRDADRVEIRALAHRVGIDQPLPIAELSGSMAQWVELQAQLVVRVLNQLTGEQAQPASLFAAQSTTLDAQERFVKARRAFLRGEYETAVDFALQASAADPLFSEPIGFLGVCFARLGRYDDAAAKHEALRLLGERRNDARLQVEAQANLGVMYYFKGEYATADVHYQRAAELAERHGQTPELAQIYNNLGFILFRLGRPDAAESAFLRSIELHRGLGALISLVGPYNGLGNVLIEQQRFDEAANYYRRALGLALEIGDRTKIGVSHMHLGRCAALAGKFSEAKTEFALACNALEETSFWNGLARVYEYMAEMNFQLADYAEAARCADRRLELAIRHTNRAMEQSAREQKAEALRLAQAGQARHGAAAATADLALGAAGDAP